MPGVRLPLSLMYFNFFSYFLYGVVLLSSLKIFLSPEPIISVVFLIAAFLSSSFIGILLEYEFVALLFVVVYVGAISILFLFIVMTLDLKKNLTFLYEVKYFPLTFFFCTIFSLELYSLIKISLSLESNFYNFLSTEYNIITNLYKDWYSRIDKFSQADMLGQILYTHYIVEFLVAGLILFISLFGVMVITTTVASIPTKLVGVNEIYFVNFRENKFKIKNH